MMEFNPLAQSLLGSVTQDRQLAIQKNRQARRQQTLQRNIAAEDEHITSEVEGAHDVNAVDEEEQQHQMPSRSAHPHSKGDEDDSSGLSSLDITG